MPLTKIEVRRRRSDAEVEAIIQAVYEAQREALKVPVEDRQIRYVEHDPRRFAVMPDHTENFTLVEIAMFAGRSLEAKRRLYASIVRRLGGLGIAPNDVVVLLHEAPLDNWGLRGVPASSVDLGYSLDV
jgi:phenylpyruvate tautomerase PptA (4-oxalocrotonate tautomerase family)